MRIWMSFAFALMTATLLAETQMTTIGETLRLGDEDFARGIPFTFTCQVTASCGAYLVALEDETGRTCISLDWKRHCAVGDRVRVTGRTAVSHDRTNYLTIYQVKVLEHGVAPAPKAVTISELWQDEFNCRLVTTTGTVLDAFVDEIDPRCCRMILSAGQSSVIALLSADTANATDRTGWINAEVRLTGLCRHKNAGWRIFNTPSILLDDPPAVEVIKPAPADPFDVEPLADVHHVHPKTIVGVGHRQACGTVIAAWHGDRFLFRTDKGRVLQAIVARNGKLPTCGDIVRVVGMPETDMFHVTLTCAIWRKEGVGSVDATRPDAQSASAILTDDRGVRTYNVLLHGKPVCLRGSVKSTSAGGDFEMKILIDSDGVTVPLDASACPAVLDAVSVGCRIEATGICLMESDRWSPDNPMPRIRGFLVILRTADDLAILSRPPWWTVGRLLTFVLVLLLVIVAILIWNRRLNRIVIRRSRALAKEQIAHCSSLLKIGERTRLAVELHDALSQNLAGIACQVAAARNFIDQTPGTAKSKLLTAERMLKSCRTELRNCLFDLKGNTLEDPDFANAIRTTLAQIETDADFAVRFNVPRARLHDSTAHAILCIVRELAANAVRHGDASRIRVAGVLNESRLVFSVRNDGKTFDPASCDGPVSGHFGLSGIRDRIRNLGGTFDIRSAPDGTRAVVSIPLHLQEKAADLP